MIAPLLAALLLVSPARAQTTRVEADAGASGIPRVTPLASPLSAPAPTLSATPSLMAASAFVPAPVFAAAPMAAASAAPAPLPAAAAFSAAAPALTVEAKAAASIPAENPDKSAAAAAAPAAEAAATPAAEPTSRIRAFLRRLANPFGTKTAEETPPASEAERLDRDFAKLDLWSQVGPAAKAEIDGLRAKKLSKAAAKEYVRREVNAAFDRIKAARGTENIGLHFNLHGGQREGYVGAGIRASKGDIALRYSMSADANDKVYFFQTAAHDAYSALDASNGEIMFFPSRMGHALNVFAVDAPELKAAMADGRITDVGAISMDFHRGMRGVPYSAYLAPPMEVFIGTAKKIGIRKLSRDEETLATARFLEAALTAAGSYVPGGTAASAEAAARGAAARAQAAASAGPETSIPPQFALVDGAYLYHGTTLGDLVKVVKSGGRMAPDVSQFSFRARDSVGYASERRRRVGGKDNPEVLLQFRGDDLNALVSGEQFRPALAVTDRGMPPVHAAYVAAVKPVPLSLMTPRSKESILSWLRARAAREPGEPKWAALAASFEAAFNAP